MIIALACGLAAAFGTWKLISAAPQQDQAKVVVLVPKEDIPQMTRLTSADKFQQKEILRRDLRDPEEVITDFEKIKNNQARFKLTKDKPFYKQEVMLGSNSFDDRLNEDEVAFTIPVDPNRGGAGFVQVGSHVDVLGNIPSLDPTEPPAIGVVLENIEVLGINNQGQNNPDGTPMQPDRFTLRVKREVAQDLIAVQQAGSLYIALRKDGVDRAFRVPPRGTLFFCGMWSWRS